MEIHDELVTPGCPQCAVKHLCAALSYAADGCDGGPEYEQMGDEYVLAARAIINFAESRVGYKSHRDFAIGLLERAERAADLYLQDDFVKAARDLRIALINGSSTGTPERNALHSMLHPSAYMWAHLVEAARELPSMCIPTGDPSVEAIQALLKAVREEYFDLPEAAVAEGEQTTKEKEPDMATAKKKAVPAKGAKCAAKGGKTACKGGKCKK